MKLICGDCKAIRDTWDEMDEHKKESHPAPVLKVKEGLREYDTSKIDYKRADNAKNQN
jgi:hypothetical protein